MEKNTVILDLDKYMNLIKENEVLKDSVQYKDKVIKEYGDMTKTLESKANDYLIILDNLIKGLIDFRYTDDTRELKKIKSYNIQGSSEIASLLNNQEYIERLNYMIRNTPKSDSNE